MADARWYLILLLAVGIERVAELVVSKRNISWSKSQGGVEYGGGHYPAMVALHTGLLIGCAAEVLIADRPFLPLLGWPALAVVLASQALRWSCIANLGKHWNTKIVVIPGRPLVRTGPYRWLHHPNYVAVVAEGAALPLVHTGWITAVVFTVLNAFLLRVRIRTENAALATAST